MKQAQNARKQRTRNTPRKGGGKNHSNGNPGNRSENKSRGNPKQLLEKYKNQARDALQAGDRVTAEYYFQFADHYQRLLNEMQPQQSQQPQQAQQQSPQDDEGQHPRRGRGRGRRDDNAQQSDNQKQDAEQPSGEQPTPVPAEGQVDTVTDQPAKVDPAVQKQPVEVHPELDLGAEAEEKPKRKAPVRRKRAPKKAADTAGQESETPKDDEAA